MEYTVKDIPLLKRAAPRWPITNSHRADIVRDMHKIASDSEQSEKHRMQAADILRKIDGLNLAEEKMLMSRMDVTDNLAELTDAQVEERLRQLTQALQGTHDVGSLLTRTDAEAAAREATTEVAADQQLHTEQQPE